MTTVETLQARDLARRPVPAALLWGLPIALGFGANFLKPTLAEESFVWSLGMAWMGVGCSLNALRCSRLHCMLSAPVLFVAAGLSAGVGLGAAAAWPWALNAVVWGAFALVMLSFAPEFVRGRYGER